MKVVDVCAFYAPKGGGVRTYVDRKLAWGQGAGHEVVVVAPGQRTCQEWRSEGGRIQWIRAPRFPLDLNYRYFADAQELHDVLDAERPDLVEASSPWRSASMVAAWRGSAPRALIMHADPLAAYAYRWFEDVADRATVDRHFDWYWRHLRRLGRSFDAVVSASASLSARLVEGGLGNVATHPMGVEPGIFSPALRDADLRRRLLDRCGLGEDGLLLLGVGRHAPEKRWPMVIEAVISAGYACPVGLVLVGNGRERARIARHIGDNPHVHLLAPIADRFGLARLMASADALVHGCEAETFCMVAAEAAASGLPLIVPDRGGASDQARRGADLTYSAGNAASLAAAIERFGRRRAGSAIGSSADAPVRTMDDHFAALFAHYEGMRAPMRVAA